MIANQDGQSIGGQLIDALTGAAFTGSVSVYITKDAGVQALGTVGGGICTAEGNGYYSYRPSADETNGQLIAKITKSEETDAWSGHKIVLYDDPSVSFGGKLVGGIRVRAPRLPAAARPAQAQAPRQAAPPPPPVDPGVDPAADDMPF